MNAEYLHLVPDVENLIICKMCLMENRIPHEKYLDIKEIFKESSESDGKLEPEINLIDSYF